MGFTVGSIIAAMPNKLAGRQVASAVIAEECRKTVLELTEDYDFPLLQIPGPVITFPTGQITYPYSYFYPAGTPSDEITEINRIVSIYLYNNGQAPLPFGSSGTGANTGYNLKYRSRDTMEIEFNIQSIPIHWTRFNDQIWISYAPNMLYYAYATLQQEHPFPNQGTINAGNDPILMPNSWQDIVEYCTVERIANDLRLNDISTAAHNIVYGDPKWQSTGGTEGAPGLLFARTSQNQRDQTSGGAVKALRMYMRPYQKGGRA